MEEIIKSVARNQLQLYLRMPFGKRSRQWGQMQPCKLTGADTLSAPAGPSRLTAMALWA